MNNKPGVGREGLPTDVNEYFRMLAKIRAQEEKDNPWPKNSPAVDPVICNGVADIDAHENEKEM